MNLWIRSQDRTKLIKVEELIIRNNNTIFRNAPAFDELGTYKTKERALEVLDEIHQRLIDLQSLEIMGSEINPRIFEGRSFDNVYIMPKE